MSAAVEDAASPHSSARPSMSSARSAAYVAPPSPVRPVRGSVGARSAVASSEPTARERDLLSAEEAKVLAVQESMAACQQLTDGMLAILSHFDRKLKALELSMQPLHRGTVQLINAHKNIESTLSETDRLIAYVAVATELDSEAGGLVPSSSPAHATSALSPLSAPAPATSSSSSSPLSAHSSRHISVDCGRFLSWLSDVSAALSYFGRHSDYRNAQLYVRKLKELQRRALIECSAEYERLLSQHCRPVDPTRVQWPLSLHIDLMPHAAAQQLAAIARGMSDCGVTTFAAVLVRERSATLRASIKRAIKDEQLNPLRDTEELRAATDMRLQQQQQQQLLQPMGETRQERDSEVSRSSVSSSALQQSQSGSAATTVKAVAPSTPQHSSLAAVSAASHQKAAQLSAKEKEKLDERRRHELYRSNTHIVIFHIRLLMALMAAERELLRRLLAHTSLAEDGNRAEFQRVFADICSEAVAYLVRKEEDKLRNWSKVEVKAENRLLALLDITQHMHSALPGFQALLAPSSAASSIGASPLSDFHSLLLGQLRRQMVEYGQYVSQYEDADKGLAVGAKKRKKDGGVHVLTIELLMLCRRLADYRNALDSMTRQQVLDTQLESAPAARDRAERDRQQRERREREEAADFERKRAKGKLTAAALEAERVRLRDMERRAARDQLTASTSNSVYAAIVWQLLQWLETKLEQQARQLLSRHATLAAIFQVNNLHYMATFISRHAQLPALAHYFALATKHATADYRVASFDKLLAALPSAAEADTLAASFAAEGSSSDRSRKAIKAIFAAFNAAFDEQCNTQRSFSISDAELRHSLRQSNVQLVLPRYRPVFDKLSGLSFTTKPTKYCKYTPQVVEQMIGTFFDEAE